MKFNDQPNAVRGLDLTSSKEMDLFVKWLGKESATQLSTLNGSGLSMLTSQIGDSG